MEWESETWEIGRQTSLSELGLEVIDQVFASLAEGLST